MRNTGLCCIDLFLGELVVRHGIKTFDTLRHITIRDALYFQLMHANEIGNLLETDGRIVNQPNSGRLSHNWFCHDRLSFKAQLSRRLKRLSRRTETVSIVGELAGYIVSQTK